MGVVTGWDKVGEARLLRRLAPVSISVPGMTARSSFLALSLAVKNVVED